MQAREITCCFTGHRIAKLPWGTYEKDSRCLALKQQISKQLVLLYEDGYRCFLCGMALGCDTYFAEEVLLLRQQFPDISLLAVVPCKNQDALWEKEQKERYASLLTRCDETILLHDSFTPLCMEERNRFMVDRSSAVLSYFDGTPGGTMNTLLLAERKGLRKIILSPSCFLF